MFKFIWVVALAIVVILFVFYTAIVVRKAMTYQGTKRRFKYIVDEHEVLFDAWCTIAALTVLLSFLDWISWIIKG